MLRHHRALTQYYLREHASFSTDKLPIDQRVESLHTNLFKPDVL
jgi:hypothetical protein